jgi:3'-phosphoadenosine 5'-phosphosulfate sulfotransferase (PAPS reductase)/FAD synthetase
MKEPAAILAAAIAEHEPVAVFACFSGGHDSLVSTHWTMENAPALTSAPVRVLHINTGIGIEETRIYVRDLCDCSGWPLWERHAPEGEYERQVCRFGFPAPAQHAWMYRRLKQAVVEAVCREAKTQRGQRVMFVTGIRRDESTARSGYKDTYRKKGAAIWVNPLYDKSRAWFDAYRAEHRLPRNRVKDIYGQSGECLCGAFADFSERAILARHFPDTLAHIERLEAKAEAAGYPWKWSDQGPPDWWMREKHGQIPLDFDGHTGPLCHGCGKAEALAA